MDTKKKIVELDLNDILPNRFQPRIIFDESGLLELTESIKAHGVIQPIIVRRLGDKFEIIAGERRCKASRMANRKTIPAIITDFNDKQSSEIALIENVQRRDLTPIEEAISYKRILDMNGMTQDELAKKLGKTQSTIANKLRLLNLTDDVQDALLEGKISERHARSLLRVKDSSQQKYMLKRIIEERLTVRGTDEEIDKMFMRNENQEVNINNVNQTNEDVLNIPSSGIIDDDNINAIDTNNDSGIDMLYNQATMNIPKIMGEDIQNYENKVEEQKLAFDAPVEELSLGFEKQNNDFNPGFMNISDIESNAKDIFEEKPRKPFIFAPQPEPVVAPEEPVQENIVEPVVEERTPLINPMFMNQEENAEEIAPETVQPAFEPVTTSNPFEFDFVPAETVVTNDIEIPALADLEMYNSFTTQPEVSVQPQVVSEPTVVTSEEPAQESVVVPVVETDVPTPVVTMEHVVASEEPVQENIIEPVVENDMPAPVVAVEPVVETNISTPSSPVDEGTLPIDENFGEPMSAIETQVEIESPIVETLTSDVSDDNDDIEILDLTGEFPIVTNETITENNLQNSELSNDTTDVVEPIQEEIIEEPKEEKKGFFDRLKSLVDGNKEEKLDNPVVDPMINMDNVPTQENISVPETVSDIDSEINVATNVDMNDVVVPDIIDNSKVINDNIQQVQEDVSTDAIVDVTPNFEVSDEVNAALPVEPLVNEEKPVKLEEIPADIMTELTNNESQNLLDGIVDDNLDKTIELPKELAEIVLNPELTNNFADNEEIETPNSVGIIDNVETVTSDVADNTFASPFENILDSVVLPEENNNAETPVSNDRLITIEELATPDSGKIEEISIKNTDQTEEFNVFEPEKLPIDDEEEQVGEDLTVPLYSPIYEEPVISVPTTTEKEIVNMGSAMRIIRDAVNQLQDLGFIVDTEEFDFEDMYQVIFKINKVSK